MGNIASVTQNGKLTSYTYDKLGQLTRVNDQNDTTSGSSGTTWVYTYDRGGNILSKTRYAYTTGTLGAALQTIPYEYDDTWKDKLVKYNGAAITYDAIGNPLSDGTWTYTWEKGRQLKQMTKSGTTATFAYNADGLRIRKTVGSTVTNYTLHGKNIVYMTQGSNTLHFWYDASNKPSIVQFNGTKYAYLHNLQGDIVGIVDSAGNEVVKYIYDPWGKILSTSSSLASTLGTIQPFRYRGYVYDEETDLYYLRSRYYKSEWARFVNPDAYIKPSYNLYQYCSPAPIGMVDPDGTAEFWEIYWDELSNASLWGPCALAAYAGTYKGNNNEVGSWFDSYKVAKAQENAWINSRYNTSSSNNAATPEMLKETATRAAKQYTSNNPGKGSVYGTKGHTFVETEITKQYWSNVKIEASYKDGSPIGYGAPGSVRLDLVLLDNNGLPSYAIDLKFGVSPLTQRRIDQINRHLPNPIHIDQVP